MQPNKNSINFGVFGFSGKLGREVISVFKECGYNLVYSKDDKVENKVDKPELLIDCSLQTAFESNIKIVEEFSVPLIFSVTGLSNDQLEKLKKLSKNIPIVQSNNYSYGIQVILDLIKISEKKLKGWDVEITETHHRFKKDKPSGTAKMLENALEQKDVNISSLRLGNVFGEHEVQFGGLGEVISIKHKATSRRTFAEGIYKSAEFILNKANGFYSFTDVIKSLN